MLASLGFGPFKPFKKVGPCPCHLGNPASLVSPVKTLSNLFFLAVADLTHCCLKTVDPVSVPCFLCTRSAASSFCSLLHLKVQIQIDTAGMTSTSFQYLDKKLVNLYHGAADVCFIVVYIL